MSNVTCPVCSGSGVVPIEPNSRAVVQCPTCNGFCLVPSADSTLQAFNPATEADDGSDNVAADGDDVDPAQDD